jgi:hypothetical protein
MGQLTTLSDAKAGPARVKTRKTAAELAALAAANAARAMAAGPHAAAVCQRALPYLSAEDQVLARARITNPGWSWAAVAAAAGTTKDRAIGRYRRHIVPRGGGG